MASRRNANVALQNLLEPLGTWNGLLGSSGHSLGGAWCFFMPLGSIWGSAAWTERKGTHMTAKVQNATPCLVVYLAL